MRCKKWQIVTLWALVWPLVCFGIYLQGSASELALAGLYPEVSSGSYVRISYTGLYQIPSADIMEVESLLSEGKWQYVIGLQQLRAADYKVLNYSLGLSRKLGAFSIAYKQHYISESIDQKAEYHSFGSEIEASLTYHALRLGLQSQNVFGSDAEYLLFLNANPSGDIAIGMGINRDEYRDISFRIAALYNVSEYLALLSSWQNESSALAMGLRMQIQNWELLYAIKSHPALPYTHAIDLCFKW